MGTVKVKREDLKTTEYNLDLQGNVLSDKRLFAAPLPAQPLPEGQKGALPERMNESMGGDILAEVECRAGFGSLGNSRVVESFLSFLVRAGS